MYHIIYTTPQELLQILSTTDHRATAAMPVLAKASLYVGVDVGTQGTKALVYDSKKNKVVSRGARPYEIEKTKVPGRAEQHPSLWIEVCCD